MKLGRRLRYCLVIGCSIFISGVAQANGCNLLAASQLLGAAYSWSENCIDGLPSGRGVATFADGRVYSGEMLTGRFVGKGTLSLPDGTRYTGEFVDGKYQGQGVFTFANGDRYIGGFEAGEMHGAGLFRPAGSDERYQVEYANGERVRFELEVQAAVLLQDPVLIGIAPEMLRRVAKVDAYIRRTLGLQPSYSSGLRSETKNQAVGGVLHSLHLQGRAVDLVAPGITPAQEALVVSVANQQGLGALWHGVGENYHLHLQLADE